MRARLPPVFGRERAFRSGLRRGARGAVSDQLDRRVLSRELPPPFRPSTLSPFLRALTLAARSIISVRPSASLPLESPNGSLYSFRLPSRDSTRAHSTQTSRLMTCFRSPLSTHQTPSQVQSRALGVTFLANKGSKTATTVRASASITCAHLPNTATPHSQPTPPFGKPSPAEVIAVSRALWLYADVAPLDLMTVLDEGRMGGGCRRWARLWNGWRRNACVTAARRR